MFYEAHGHNDKVYAINAKVRGKQRTDSMHVLGAVADPRLRDRIVRAELAVLVRSTVDGEHAR